MRQQNAYSGKTINVPPRVRLRRESWVVEPVFHTRHPARSGESFIMDGVWDDTGDEPTPTRPCAPTGITARESPLATQPPAPDCQEGCFRTEAKGSTRREEPAPVLHSITRGGYHGHIWKTTKFRHERSRSGRRFSPHHSATPKQYSAFPTDVSPTDCGGWTARQSSRWGLQKSAPANGEHEKSLARECSSNTGVRQGCDSLSEECQGAAVMQGYCNWLLAGKVTKVRWCFQQRTKRRATG